VFHTSDLANSNLLVSGNRSRATNVDLISRTIPENPGDNRINIYPNPVTNNHFTIEFNDLSAGSYTLQVTDVMGRQIMQQSINISGDKQLQNIKLTPAASKGVYLVKVTNAGSKAVFSTKIVVQ
jgi:hypothetical protein